VKATVAPLSPEVLPSVHAGYSPEDQLREMCDRSRSLPVTLQADQRAGRILALTAAIWHNDATSQPVMRSLLAYDH
jgi:hypothetical protein